MTQPEPEHWPTERMILEGHAEHATLEDLEELTDSELVDVARICEVDQFAPDECIPCRAHTVILDRRQAERDRLEAMNPPEPADSGDEEIPEPDFGSDDTPDMPKLERLLSTPPPWEEPQTVLDQIAEKIKALDDIVDELLNGPPIPPKDVSLPELAMLVLAADKWVKITEVQGTEMSPSQQMILDSTKNLVARLRP